MERTRPLLVPVFACILLASQILQGETETRQSAQNSSYKSASDNNYSTSGNEAPQVVIDENIGEDRVVFNFNVKTEESRGQYEAAYSTRPLACPKELYPPNCENWTKINGSLPVPTKPYTNVTVCVRLKDSGIIEEKVVSIEGKEPKVMIKTLNVNSVKLIATMDGNCKNFNGKNIGVRFVLESINATLQNQTKKIVIDANFDKFNTAILKCEDLDLLPITNYRVTAYPRNNFGIGNIALIRTGNFVSSATKPNKVRDFKVVAHSPYALQLSWEAPDNDPPTGTLDEYKIKYEPANTSGPKWKKSNTTDTLSTVIRNLEPDTNYIITITAKNKEKLEQSEPVTINGTTSKERELDPVVGLTSMAVNGTTTLQLSWSWSSSDFGLLNDNIKYKVKLKKKDFKTSDTSDTSYTFHNLSAGTEYKGWVKACIRNNMCSSRSEFRAWTWPQKPDVQPTTVNVIKETDTTIAIFLPTLKNPPGVHSVVLKKIDGKESRLSETEKESAKEVVRKMRHSAPKRSRRSMRNDEEPYVKEIPVKEDDKQPMNVTLGEDSPLKSNTKYLIIVVTEKTAGDNSEYYVSEPIFHKTKRTSETAAVLGVISGICVAALVVAFIAVVLVVKYKNRRRKPLPVEDNPNFRPDSPITLMVLENDKIPLGEGVNGTLHTFKGNEDTMEEKTLNKRADQVQEDLYANVSLEVKREDLNTYLTRGVFATDTSLEFDSVPSHMPGKSASDSRLPVNVPKNRYRNEISYNDTRVKLPLYNDIPHSDFINANFVKDPTGRNAFIATQGPKDHNVDTIGAFWRMIWHANCYIIVMVANLVEGGKTKVAQYWPETEPMVKEGVKVTLTSVRIVMDFAVRTFTVSVGGMEREITQYQYVAWPDHGVPQIAYGLGKMLKTVIKHYEGGGRTGPITVHCSAGIGRTGTVILTMFILRQLDMTNAINPRVALHTLREGRGRLVENKEQYVFVHKLIHEILFGMKTILTCDSFVKQVPHLRSSKAQDGTWLLQKELEKIKNLPKDLTFNFGKDSACAYLNRNQDILPADKCMVFVQVRGGGTGMDAQYLNVIRISGFDKKDAYIAGEHPLPQTLGKMWRLVYERRVSVWILLQELPTDDPSFPDVICESSSLPQNMSLEASQTHQFENFTEYSTTLSVNELGRTEGHKCTVLKFKGWPHTARLPSSPEGILSIIEKAESLLSPGTIMLFTCSDGVTGCGIMAALMQAIARARLTQEVDLYRSVASVQYERPQFILDHAQYDFLYAAMGAFLDNNRHYGNFA